jgi:hypothetical protein
MFASPSFACAWGKQSPLIVHPGGRRAWKSEFELRLALGILDLSKCPRRAQVNGANQGRENSALPAAVFELASHFILFPHRLLGRDEST